MDMGPELLEYPGAPSQARAARVKTQHPERRHSLDYVAQAKPEGIAQAFILGRDFLAGAPSALVLGDNVFYGQGLQRVIVSAANRQVGATVFGYWVKNASAYGVAEFGADGVV